MKKNLILLFLISITLVFAVDIWEDDFEELTGWILNGEFEIDSPQGLGGEYGNADPDSAFAGSYVLGVDLTGLGASLGDYETDLGTHEYFAISPAIDCSEFVEIELSFMKWLNVEQPAYDHAYISVSNDDGTTWIEIWTNTAQIAEDSWSSINFDISEIADLSSNVRIRFSIGATDGSWQFSGWNIDNLVITGNSVVYGAIDGNVIDVDNGEPSVFAQVMSQYGNTMSDDEGYFTLNNIPVGNRDIMVYALGFLPFTEANINVIENEITYVSCELTTDPNIPPSPQNPQALVINGNDVHLTWEEPDLPTEELLAYNVYRNGIIVQSVLTEEYFDLDLIDGYYSYTVSAVYDSGESLPTNAVNVEIENSEIEYDLIPQNGINISNYPNPFNPTTTISFNLTTEITENTELIIYNIKGQRVKYLTPSLSHPELVEGRGVYKVMWDGTDQTKKPVSSGIYFYQLDINGKIAAKNKMMLLK